MCKKMNGSIDVEVENELTFFTINEAFSKIISEEDLLSVPTVLYISKNIYKKLKYILGINGVSNNNEKQMWILTAFLKETVVGFYDQIPICLDFSLKLNKFYFIKHDFYDI